MGKLPATSYVRMVDIWLIFGQLYPFVQARKPSNFHFRFLNSLYLGCPLHCYGIV